VGGRSRLRRDRTAAPTRSTRIPSTSAAHDMEATRNIRTRSVITGTSGAETSNGRGRPSPRPFPAHLSSSRNLSAGSRLIELDMAFSRQRRPAEGKCHVTEGTYEELLSTTAMLSRRLLPGRGERRERVCLGRGTEGEAENGSGPTGPRAKISAERRRHRSSARAALPAAGGQGSDARSAIGPSRGGPTEPLTPTALLILTPGSERASPPVTFRPWWASSKHTLYAWKQKFRRARPRPG